MKTKVAKEYLGELRKRYIRAKKVEKHIILNELTKTAGYDRKYAINLLRGNYKHKQGRIYRPRGRKYTFSDAIILVKVCRLLDWINAKRIQPQIGIAIDSLVLAGELSVLPEQRKKLIKISPSTIDRLLKTHKKRPVGKGRSYTKPGTLLKTQIPVRTFADWKENKVGFFEIDLVGHEGGNASGDFAFTLDFVDVKVQWTEQVAVKNKAQIHVFAGIKMIRGRLPFPILGYDSDSGSEFINHQLYRYRVSPRFLRTCTLRNERSINLRF